MKLANEDITKVESVTEQNFVNCLTTLMFWLERDEQQKRDIEKQRNKSKRR